MAFKNTPYGSVFWFADMETVRISATHSQLYDWANRPGYSWPCSTLTDCTYVSATFNADGLVDIDHPGTYELDANEFNAWSSDVLRDVLSPDHPAYEVTVGQFIERAEGK